MYDYPGKSCWIPEFLVVVVAPPSSNTRAAGSIPGKGNTHQASRRKTAWFQPVFISPTTDAPTSLKLRLWEVEALSHVNLWALNRLWQAQELTSLVQEAGSEPRWWQGGFLLRPRAVPCRRSRSLWVFVLVCLCLSPPSMQFLLD